MGPFPFTETSLLCGSLFSENFSLENMSFRIDQQTHLAIQKALYMADMNEEDIMFWEGSQLGNLKVSDAYKFLLREHSNMDAEWIWKTKTLPKIQFFLWLGLHKATPTSVLLANRGLDINPIYV